MSTDAKLIFFVGIMFIMGLMVDPVFDWMHR